MKVNYVYLMIFSFSIAFSACIGTYEAPGPGNGCCIFDTSIPSGQTDTTSQFLCIDGEIFGCRDTPNGVGTLYGECIEKQNTTDKFYCIDSRWDSNDRTDTCPQACTGIWFGGDGEKGCCESGEEFVYGGVIEKNITAQFKFEYLTNNHVFDKKNGLFGEAKNGPQIVTSEENVVEDTAISFDGINDYIEIPTSQEVELDKNLTIAFWMKPNNVGTARINPIDKNYGGEFAFTIETSGSLSFYHGTQRVSGYYTTFNALDPGMVKNGVWQFVVVTRNVETRNLTSYYDGRMQNTATYSSNTNYWPSVSTYPVTIGDGYVNNFGGIIDEISFWNRTLSSEEVLMLYRSFPEKVQNDVIGYWKFDKGTGTIAKDSSSYNFDGSFYSDPEWTTIAKSGNALVFDGDASPNGDYVGFSNSPSRFNVDINTKQSMSIWINPNKTSQSGYYFWKEGGCVGWSMFIESDGDLGCTLRVGNNTCTGYSTFTATTSNINHIDGGWHNVICVIDRPNTNMSLYVDGELTDSVVIDNTLISNGGSLRIGTQWNNNNPFNGSIDEVLVVDDALTLNEVKYIYNSKKWNKFACNQKEINCEGGECTTSVYENGIPYYCSNGFFTDFRYTVDSCSDSCTNQGGTWVGGGVDKNCCINSQEFWCNESAGLDTICYGGSSSDCNSWCDAHGVVGSYTCSPSQDGDCVASLSCSGGDCECLKANELACTGDIECSLGNCQNYVSESITESSLGKMFLGGLDNICCGQNECSYNSGGDPQVDRCAANNSTSVDSDGDGDLDYCLNNLWKECPDYLAENGLANDCSCLGRGIAVNKSDVWVCRAQPVNFTYDSLNCGTSCDSDSIVNDEMVDQNGYCVLAKDSCSEVINDISWTGNDTLVDILIDTSCPCKEAASCDIWVGENFTQTSIVNGTVQIIPDFKYGTNNISVTCSCSNRQVSCENLFPVVVDIQSEVFVSDCVAGKNCDTKINITNLGNIGLNTSSKLETYYTKTQNTFLEESQILTYSGTPSCSLLVPTWTNKLAKTPVNYSFNLSFSDVKKIFNFEEQGGIIQCVSNSDCTTCCNSTDSCWLNSSNENDYTCSSGVCCPSNEHFQNGACCSVNERCCIDDLGCNIGEWCSNQSVAPNGDFTCKDKKEIGQFCSQNRECVSRNCGNGICSDPEPVALSEWYACSPYLGNDYCNYESVSGNNSFDPVGCNLDSDCSSNFYCYLPRRACIECSGPDTKYQDLNLSKDGYCPSLSCLGSDLDCCSLDSDCESGQWCHASASCTKCSDQKEGVCSSTSCFGIDPDCCTTDSDCGQGLRCVANTCTGNLGEVCESDSTCSGGLKCLNGICGKENFVALIPEGPTSGSIGDVLKFTLVVSDPVGRQGGYVAEVDTSYIPDSSFIYIDGLKQEEFGLSKGDAKKFLVTVYGGKNKDIFGKIRVSHKELSQIQDDVIVDVSISPTNLKNVPVAPLDSWFLVVIIGYLMGMVTLG